MQQKPKILIVDDDAGTRSAIQIGLSRLGYVVAGAKSCEEGKRLLEDSSYDLLLLDIQIGAACGIDLLREIRQEMGLQLPILMISGLADIHNVAETKKHGIAGFVVKPFDPDVLKEKISACLLPRLRRAG